MTERLEDLSRGAAMRFLRSQRAVVHHHQLPLGRPAGAEQLLDQFGQLVSKGVADDRAAECDETLPVDVGERTILFFVAPYERDRIARAWVAERHTRIRRDGDRCGDAG